MSAINSAFNNPGQGYILSQTSTGGLDIKALMKQYTDAQEKANAENEKRYQQALGLYDTLGKSGAEDITKQTGQQQAGARQNLVERGLGNTTIGSSVATGIASQGQSNLLRLQESLASQKAGLMERRNDQGPNLGLYANLLQQANSKPSAVGQPFGGNINAGGGGEGGGGISGGTMSMGGGGGGGTDNRGTGSVTGPSYLTGGGSAGGLLGGTGTGTFPNLAGAASTSGNMMEGAQMFPADGQGSGVAPGGATITPSGTSPSTGDTSIVDMAKQMAGPDAGKIGYSGPSKDVSVIAWNNTAGTAQPGAAPTKLPAGAESLGGGMYRVKDTNGYYDYYKAQ
jgi:hypothetical protein